MALISVDTDGVSGDYSGIAAAVGAVSFPLTEDTEITLDASTAVHDALSSLLNLSVETSTYVLTFTGSADYVLDCPTTSWVSASGASGRTSNIIFDGVNFDKTSQDAAYQYIMDFNQIRNSEIEVKCCDFKYSGETGQRARVLRLSSTVVATTESKLVFVNNVVHNVQATPTSVANSIFFNDVSPTGQRTFIYNNTLIGGYATLYNTGGIDSHVFKNNIAEPGNRTGADTNTVSDYNMSSVATDFGGTNDEVSQTFVFEDAGADDYHLDSTDTGARGKGTDLSSDSDYPFSTDKDGVTRSAWDAGAYEFVAGGGTVYNNTISEAAGFTDTVSYSLDFGSIVNETVGLTDTNSMIIDFISSVAEAVGLTDTVSQAHDLLSTISESIGLSDAVNFETAAIEMTVSESVGFADTISTIHTLTISVDETAGFDDTVDGIAQYGISILEAIGLTDTNSSGTLINGRICVTITGTKPNITITGSRPFITITGEGC